jgi:hypothetical protein
MSGKTTHQGASQNQGACGVKNRIAVRPIYLFSITPAVGVLKLKYVYGLVSLKVRGFFVKGNLHYQTKPGNNGFFVFIVHREIFFVLYST